MTTVDALVDAIGSEHRAPQMIVRVVSDLTGLIEQNSVILSFEPDSR